LNLALFFDFTFHFAVFSDEYPYPIIRNLN
jgi:hypothetical protein